MRRCLFLAPFAVIMAGCGGTHHSTAEARTEPGLRACSVHVYFASHAGHVQEAVVGAKLRQNPRVRRVVSTSKAQALAAFKKTSPILLAPIPKRNPFPDSFTVVPAMVSDLRQVHASIAGARWPGVATLKLAPCRHTN